MKIYIKYAWKDEKYKAGKVYDVEEIEGKRLCRMGALIADASHEKLKIKEEKKIEVKEEIKEPKKEEIKEEIKEEKSSEKVEKKVESNKKNKNK